MTGPPTGRNQRLPHCHWGAPQRLLPGPFAVQPRPRAARCRHRAADRPGSASGGGNAPGCHRGCRAGGCRHLTSPPLSACSPVPACPPSETIAACAAVGFAFCGIAAFFFKILIFRTAQLRCRLAHRLGRGHHPEIMLGKLEIALGHHIVAGGLRIAAKLHVFLGNRLRRAAHLNVRPVALINPVGGIAAAIVVCCRLRRHRPACGYCGHGRACCCAGPDVRGVHYRSSNHHCGKNCRPMLLRFCITISKIGPDQRVELILIRRLWSQTSAADISPIGNTIPDCKKARCVELVTYGLFPNMPPNAIARAE